MFDLKPNSLAPSTAITSQYLSGLTALQIGLRFIQLANLLALGVACLVFGTIVLGYAYNSTVTVAPLFLLTPVILVVLAVCVLINVIGKVICLFGPNECPGKCQIYSLLATALFVTIFVVLTIVPIFAPEFYTKVLAQASENAANVLFWLIIVGIVFFCIANIFSLFFYRKVSEFIDSSRIHKSTSTVVF